MQANGCAALFLIAAGGAACAQAVAEVGGAGAVVAALQAHRSNLDVQTTGCAALHRIAVGGAECAQVVVEAGGAGAAAAALQAHRSNSEVQVNGSVALSCVASGGTACAQVTVGAAPVVAALQGHWNDVDVQIKDCAALHDIVEQQCQPFGATELTCAPDAYVCPITSEVMTDPVVTVRCYCTFYLCSLAPSLRTLAFHD